MRPQLHQPPQRHEDFLDRQQHLIVTVVLTDDRLKQPDELADEVGARLLPLHSMHNMTPADIASGATYFTLMRRNLENIRQGLGCAP